MGKVVLYHVDMESERGQKLATALDRAGFSYSLIYEGNLCDTVGFVAGLPGYEKSMELPKKHYNSEFMLIAGLADKELDVLLAEMKKEQIFIGNKAVVTEANISWRICDLIDEIIKERQIMKNLRR